MRWLTIEKEYLDYLRSIESHIPLTDYGIDKYKPFFGELFKIKDIVYITQISHPQKRHYTLKENLDFYKLYRIKELIGVVNLNYMFPVHKNKIIDVRYKDIDKFRTFKDENEKNNYITILKKEMKEIKIKKIDEKAFELYNMKNNFPNNIISKRCIDFKLLEQKCLEYETNKQNKIEVIEKVAAGNQNDIYN